MISFRYMYITDMISQETMFRVVGQKNKIKETRIGSIVLKMIKHQLQRELVDASVRRAPTNVNAIINNNYATDQRR